MLEAAGISTVIVAVRAFRPRLEAMRVPRLVVTPWPMGRPLGLPGDIATQRATIVAALRLLETADRGGSVIEMPR